MTNVSYKKLKSDDYKIAYQQLTTLIANLNQKKAEYFLNDLLTEAERVMLVKRFAAAFMFSRDYSPYRVAKVIGVSISTAQRLYSQYAEGDFDRLFSCLSQKERNNFAKLIETLLFGKVNMGVRARTTEQMLR